MTRTLRGIRTRNAKRAAASLLLAGLAGCSLPPVGERTASSALDMHAARQTTLGRVLGPQADAHPGRAGFHTLDDARDAFAARMLLAQAAERTLDIQYYIWRGDMTGMMLLEALHAAADRGVRVRLLLDDNGTAGLDETLAALDAHPNIEVRLFNPFALRRPKMLGYLFEFRRLNRRMHNKSFTADNQATIVGGRNIGDEYFGATDGVLFADLDVLAVGSIVGDVSADFDRYWASVPAYPVGQLLPPISASRLGGLAARAATIESHPAATAYVRAVRSQPFVRELLAGTLPLTWAPARMVSDDPAKAQGRAQPEGLLAHQLAAIIGAPEKELDLVSPYFVPGSQGTAAFAAMARRGVQLRVLTNALEATDVPVVHSGYARRRKDLLEAGVRLYEMRSASHHSSRPEGKPLFGSSGSSLHAKTFGVDRTRAFIGSFNFDPRSTELNTELGFVIDSPELADRIARAFDAAIPASAYEVGLAQDGSLYWLEREDGRTIRHDTEPGTGPLMRLAIRLMSLLPIESLL